MTLAILRLRVQLIIFQWHVAPSQYRHVLQYGLNIIFELAIARQTLLIIFCKQGHTRVRREMQNSKGTEQGVQKHRQSMVHGNLEAGNSPWEQADTKQKSAHRRSEADETQGIRQRRGQNPKRSEEPRGKSRKNTGTGNR